MKILIIQERARIPEAIEWRECESYMRAFLKLGVECDIWGLNQPSFATRPDFNSYDIIINWENYDETGWVPNLSDFSHPMKLLAAIDFHCRGAAVYQHQFRVGKYFKILQPTLEFMDSDSVFLPNAFDDELISPKIVPKRADVGFCGHAHNRGKILNALAQEQGFSFIFDSAVYGENMLNALCSYRIGFNLNISNDVNYRSFEILGSGVPLVTNFNRQYQILGFKHGVNCMFYSSYPELVEILKSLSRDNAKIQMLSSNGLILSERHTIITRAKVILELYHQHYA